MPRMFTDAEISHAVQLHQAGQPFEQIASELGRSSGESLRVALRRRGIETARTVPQRHHRIETPADLHEVYESGESVLAMSHRFGVSRTAVTRWLRDAGLPVRSRSETNRLRMGAMTSAERIALTSAAHDAVRGSTLPDEQVARTAAGRERTQYGGRPGPGHEFLCSVLTAGGIDYVREKAVGRYNLDVAVPAASVAVEVLGGNWHGSKAIHARRTPYLFDRGWHLLFVWDQRRCPVGRGAYDYLIGFLEETSRDPAAARQYRVIRGNGELTATGSADDDEWPLVPPSRANLNRG